MATLDQIHDKVEQLRGELAVAIAAQKLSPKQITIVNGLSDINNSLGSVRAGEFLALSSGEDPQDSNGTGTFISAQGRTFGSKLYHIGGVLNSDLKWGANALTGELEAGDGAVNLTANGLSLYDGATEIGRFGNLAGFLSYPASPAVYGMAMGDSDQYMTYDPTNGLKVYGALVSDREILTANRTYYVATTGSDSNDGLTAGTPFLTIQYALDYIAVHLDAASYDVTIQIADGTYISTSAGFIVKSLMGIGRIIIKGNSISPANVILQTDADSTPILWNISNVSNVTVLNSLTLNVPGSGTNGIAIWAIRSTVYYNNINFGDNDYGNIYAGPQAFVALMGITTSEVRKYAITGSPYIHIFVAHGYYEESGGTVTIAGGTSFSDYIFCTATGEADFSGMTYSGSATGERGWATRNGVIEMNGLTLPGNTGPGSSYGGVVL